MSNPTEAQVSQYLEDNLWEPEEINQFLGYHFSNINPDGSTSLSHDQWEELACNF